MTEQHTKQFYYTCPIQALYMMKEFGVKFYNRTLIFVEGVKDYPEGVKDYPELSMCFKDLEREINQFGNILIKESDSIFDPISGDSNDTHFFDGHYWIGHSDKLEWLTGQMEIERRNCKHFFMPKCETFDK